MKKTLLICAALMLANAAFSQGTVAFANRNGSTTTAAPGEVIAPVYGPDPSDNTHRISGNTSTGVPAGNTSYGSSPFLFVDGVHTWTATLWALDASQASGSAQNNNLALVLVNGTATFRTSTSGTFAGIWNPPSGAAPVPGVTAVGQRAAFQIRVWDTKGGTIATWAQLTDPANNGVFRGYSDMFTVPYDLGGTAVPANPPPNLQGLASFNVFVVPEPSVIALGMLGAGCLFLLRRRK
jgi:hypothetical protein